MGAEKNFLFIYVLAFQIKLNYTASKPDIVTKHVLKVDFISLLKTNQYPANVKGVPRNLTS